MKTPDIKPSQRLASLRALALQNAWETERDNYWRNEVQKLEARFNREATAAQGGLWALILRKVKRP